VECAGGRILIDVVDAGPGIPPDLSPRIFDPFVTTKARGTGLGLALCQRVAGYLDGAVTLVATGPGGSRFRLDLPAGEAGPDGG
jgi:signal transduction histidine kinase